MCAISGKVYFTKRRVHDREILKMNKILNHRGPDDNGVFISKDGKVGLKNFLTVII